MKYHQLTERERYTIAKMRMQHFSIAEIARVLGRHRSTIHREVKRNSTQMGDRRVYCWSKAHRHRNGVLRRSREGLHHDDGQYRRVEQLLKQDWSPEQVAGLLKKQEEFSISFQTIYRMCGAIGGPGESSINYCAAATSAGNAITAWNAGAACRTSA